jgi:hypothetical protein
VQQDAGNMADGVAFMTSGSPDSEVDLNKHGAAHLMALDVKRM